MFRFSQPSTRYPVLLLIALIVPLLAACGGAAPTSISPPLPVDQRAEAGHATDTNTAPIGGGTAPREGNAQSADAAAPGTSATGSESGAAPGADSDGSVAAPAPESAPASGAIAPRPTPAPVEGIADQQRAPALRAGDVDDNDDFAAYLAYLKGYAGAPMHSADVSERSILTIVNDQQQPVLDARVRLFDGQQQVFEGRTYAGGKTIVFPKTLGLSANANELRVVVAKGNSSVEARLTRGQDSDLRITLPKAEALPPTLNLDVLFLLDATGSMGDEIGQIQSTIASIAERIDQTQPRPQVRFGLVSYRDRGDDYVTQVSDFTPDIVRFRATLLGVSAGGGGDEPEALNEGLHAAIQRVQWADDAVRLTFLVADAPPHLDYEQDYDYLQEARAAVARGVKIYSIAASNSNDQAEYVLRQLSQQTLAHFIFLTYQPGQNAGAPGDTTTHNVDPQSFTVERLDDLIVQIVQHELAQARGVS